MTKNLFSKSVSYFLSINSILLKRKLTFCCSLLLICGVTKAQIVTIPIANYYLNICNGGKFEVHIVNNTSTAINANYLFLDADFSTDFMEVNLDTVVKYPSTPLAFSVFNTPKHYYKISLNSGTLLAGDSIKLIVKIRPNCGLLQSQLTASTTASNPMPMQTPFQFAFALYSGISYSSSTLLYSLGIKPSVHLSYPQIGLYTNYQYAIKHFAPADTAVCNGCVDTDTSSSCGFGYYEYTAPRFRFYKYIKLVNLSAADTLDLTNSHTFLKINEKKDLNFTYNIKAIYIKTTTGSYVRIAANTTVGNPNPTTFLAATPSTFNLKSGVHSSFKYDTLKITGAMIYAAKNKYVLYPNDSLIFWEECVLQQNSICGKINKTQYQTEMNCVSDTSSSCYINKVNNNCSKIKFQNHIPQLTIQSNYTTHNTCYNYQDSLSPQFNTHKNQYYMIVGNIGSGNAAHLKLEFACRSISNVTNYLLSKSFLLNAHIAKTTIPVGGINSLIPSSLSLPITDSFVFNLRIEHKKGVGVIPNSLNWGNYSNLSGDYYSIDSFKNRYGDSLILKPNEALILVWEGFHELPKACNAITLNGWYCRAICYDSCNHSNTYTGTNYDWGNSNPTQQILAETVIAPDAMQGPGVSQIIGLKDDDYQFAPIDVLKFKISPFGSKKLLPSNANIALQSVVAKIEIGPLLNVWKGDMYNINNPCTYPDVSAWYDKDHLKKYVRFYIDTSNSSFPAYKRVYVNSIGYLNTAANGYFHYDSAGRPTALNGISDEIIATFNFPSGFHVSWLNKFYIEIDVQPACAKCACALNPYSVNTGYIDSTGKKAGSKTPVFISILHAPDNTCGMDTITPSNALDKCIVPKNRYCIFNGGGDIVVQCPGCNIAGLYSINAKGSRMNFGYEDNGNHGYADLPLKRIMFNQVNFSAPISIPNITIDTRSIMFHDLFRVRHKSVVHLDNINATNYYPTANVLGLPTSSLHPYERGFHLGYVRVRVSDSIGVVNFKDATNTSIQKNIPALIVWVVDGDTIHNTSYPYRSGFNAFHQLTNLFPYQTYSISAGKIDSITPIMLFYDSTRDFRDSTTKEFVYDFSIARLDSAYRMQYNPSLHLPFDYYHDKMQLYFDMTYYLKMNDGIKTIKLNEEIVVSRAYFTLSPETHANTTNFFDMQDAADTIAYHHATSSAFVATPALLDSLCPMQNSPYPVKVNGIMKNSCLNVRWWCVKGEADFTRIGFEFQPAKFTSLGGGNTQSGFCGFTTNADCGTNRYFLLGKAFESGSSSCKIPFTFFNNEYRNWSNPKRFEITGLPTGSSITKMQTKVNGGSAQDIVKHPVFENLLTHTWIVDFDSLIPTPKFHRSTSVRDSFQLIDDNESDSYNMTVVYKNCSTANYCLKIREVDAFNICNLDSAIKNTLNNGCNYLKADSPLVSNNFNNGFGLPLEKNYINCKNERFKDQSMPYHTLGNSYISASTASGTLNNGTICWSNILVRQDSAIGNNPWITIQFPPSWNDTSYTITSMSINGNVVPCAPTGIINGVHTPKRLGNHTWLYFLPNGFWKQYDGTDTASIRKSINYVNFCANYDCIHPPSDTNIVYFNAGIICDTADFKTVHNNNDLFGASCERLVQVLALNSLKPDLTVYEDSTQYQNAGLCSKFNMRFTLVNNGQVCSKHIRIKVVLPNTGSYSLTTPLGYTMPLGKNAVVKHGANKYNINLTNGIISLLPIHSNCCSDTASLPGSFMPNSSCTESDTCIIEFGVQTNCQLTYQPILDSIWSDATCGSYTTEFLKSFISYPILQNTSNNYNQLQPSFSYTNPLNIGCQIKDSIRLYLSATPISATTINNLNKLLIKLPTGITLINVKYSNKTLTTVPLLTSNICSNTAFAAFGTIQNVIVVNLDSLTGKNTATLSSLILHFTSDSSISCMDTFRAVVVTQQNFGCTINGNSSACNFCTAQTYPAISGFNLSVVKPTISLHTTNCTGKAIVVSTGSCGHPIWQIHPSTIIYSTYGDSLFLNSSNKNITIAVQDAFFNHGVCKSDTVFHIPFSITPAVKFTASTLNVPCSLNPQGQVLLNISSGVAPFNVNFNGVTQILTTYLNTWSALSSGIYNILVKDSNNCNSAIKDTIPYSKICGERYVCNGSTYLYTYTINNASQYVWTINGGTMVSNVPPNTLSVNWTKTGIDTLIVKAYNNAGQLIYADSTIIHVVGPPNPIIGVQGAWNSCFKIQVMPKHGSLVSGLVGNDTCFQSCINNSAFFTSPAVINHKYYWTASNCQIISGGNTNTVHILFDSLGSGSLSLTETDTASKCTQTVYKCLYIIDQPHAIATCINYPIVSGIINVCDSVPLNFADSSYPAADIISRTWNFGDGTITSTTNLTINHTYLNGGTYHLKLIIENECHCTDTATVIIIVDSRAGVPVTCATTKCYNDTAFYYSPAISCSGYNWAVTNGTLISGQNTSSIKVKWNGNTSNPSGHISLAVNGCSNYCNSPTNIIVPIVTPTMKINCPAVICKNDIIIVSVPMVQGNTYTWQISGAGFSYYGNGSLIRNNEIRIKAAGSVGDSIILHVIYSNCTLGCSGVANAVIKIRGEYTTQCFNGNACGKICSGGSGIYTTSQYAIDSTDKFHWYYTLANSPTVIGSSSTNQNKYNITFPTVTFPTVYWVYAHCPTVGKYCTSTDPYQEVVILPKPTKPILAQILKDSCICPNSTAILVGSPSANCHFEWATTFSGANPKSAVGNNFSTFLSGIGAYPFSVKQIMNDAPNCKGDTLKFSLKNCLAPKDTIKGKDTVCANDIQFYYVNNHYESYNWQLLNNQHGTILSGQGTNGIYVQWNNPNPTLSSATTAQIRLTVKHCGQSSNAYVPLKKVVILSGNPIQITALSTVCQGNSITFTVNSITYSACPLTGLYIWNFGDGSPLDTTLTNVAYHKYMIASSVPYVVNVAALNNNSSHLLSQATINLTVKPTPNVAITNSGLCPNTTITANITNAGLFFGTFTYVFQYNNAIYTAPVTLASTLGKAYSGLFGGNTFQVNVAATNGCVANSNAIVVNCTGGGGGTPCTIPLTDTIKITHPICSGQDTIQTIINNFPWATPVDYSVDFGDGTPTYKVIGSIISTPYTIRVVHTYKNVGSYSISIKFINTTLNCSASISKQTTIPILADFKVITQCDATNTMKCKALNLSQVLFTPATYTWSSPFNTSAIVNAATIGYGTSPTATVTINDTHGNTCSTSKSFYVPKMPVAGFVDSPWVNQCELTPIMFKDTSHAKVFYRLWTFNDQKPPHSFFSNLQNPWEAFLYNSSITPFYLPHYLGQFDVVLSITDSLLCTATSSRLLDTTKQNTMKEPTQSSPFDYSINLSQNIRANCINIGDTITFNIDSIGIAPIRTHPPFYYVWHSSLPNFTTTSSISSIVVHQPGNYWLSVTDGYGCIGNSPNWISPQFLETPPIFIKGKAVICSGEKSKYSFDLGGGSQYQYSWHLYNHAGTSIATDTTPQINIANGILTTTHAPYRIIAHAQFRTGSSCGVDDTFDIDVESLPIANIPSSSSSCLHNGQSLTLTAQVTGGQPPYTYYWMNGTWGTTTTLTINQGGQYGYHVVDSFGCNSGLAYLNITPPANFDPLVTGCLTLCDTQKICPANDWYYNQTTWLYNGSPVSLANVNSTNGQLTPVQSGFYQQVLCDFVGTCCDTSDVIDLQVIPCTTCCQADVFTIDTIFCLGLDNSGNKQYQFRLQILHNCPTAAVLQMQPNYSGTISSYSTTTIIPGNNTIWGVYTNTGTAIQFCSTITISGNDTCAHDIPCVSLPLNCSGTACNMIIVVNNEQCIGFDSYGHPMYHININIINNNPIPVDDTLFSYQGFVQQNIITNIPPNSTINTSIIFIDTLPYDAYICIYGKSFTPSHLSCQHVVCLALNTSPQCIPTNGCSFDACIEGMACLGYDSSGYPIYQVRVYFNNPFGSNPNAILSATTLQGLITNINPINPTGGMNTATFNFTNLTGAQNLCLQLIIADTAQRPYFNCFIDYTRLACLCVNPLPDCPQYRKANYTATIPNKRAVGVFDSSQVCLVKVVPNPNQGKPEIYYKVDSNGNNYDNLKIQIIESSSGKLVTTIPLEKPVGVLYWSNNNTLPQGHYVVILQQANKILCETKMEVIK